MIWNNQGRHLTEFIVLFQEKVPLPGLGICNEKKHISKPDTLPSATSWHLLIPWFHKPPVSSDEVAGMVLGTGDTESKLRVPPREAFAS